MFPWQQKQGAMTFKSRPLFISLPYVFIPGDNREIEKCPHFLFLLHKQKNKS